MGRTRMQAVLLALLFIAGVGSVAVHASPTCQRLVKTYVSTPVRDRVSKATEAAWAKWRVGHPGWKPKAGVVRPKYKMTRKEVMEKVAFACEVPTAPSETDLFFTPADFMTPPAAGVPPIETADATYPGYLAPVDMQPQPVYSTNMPALPGASGIFIPPFIPPPLGRSTSSSGSSGQPPDVPTTPPISVLTPEPGSLVLVALGMGAGMVFMRRRFAQ